MIGAIFGDIVGSVYEFNNIKTKDFVLFDKYRFFTDDTVMTVAVADALMQMNGKDEVDLFKHILVNKYLATVESAGIICRNMWWVGRDRITNVQIIRSIVTLTKIALPASRHHNFAIFLTSKQTFLTNFCK